MEKRIIKAIIAERQKEIREIQLIERPIQFEENMNYVLVGIRRAGKRRSKTVFILISRMNELLCLRRQS